VEGAEMNAAKIKNSLIAVPASAFHDFHKEVFFRLVILANCVDNFIELDFDKIILAAK
jgi:hypothetical protein